MYFGYITEMTSYIIRFNVNQFFRSDTFDCHFQHYNKLYSKNHPHVKHNDRRSSVYNLFECFSLFIMMSLSGGIHLYHRTIILPSNVNSMRALRRLIHKVVSGSRSLQWLHSWDCFRAVTSGLFIPLSSGKHRK